MSHSRPLLEADLELEFIEKLEGLKYIYRDDINDRLALEENFRQHFDTLNQVKLTDSEFKKLLASIISADIFENSKQLRNINTFEREDGTPLQYTLINIKDWCKNEFEVIHQLRTNTTYSHQRYDVILLINGIPVVQVELKRNGVVPREAMRQIYDYKNAPGSGYENSLLCFIQLFIVSNKEQTYYFANNNKNHFNFAANEKFLAIYQHADQDNRKINNLFDFADKFLPKCSLAEMIGRYITLIETEKKLVLMRPYQIYAVKYIIDSIKQQTNNGYIWHTTGSGKTLTSFKAATLLKDNPKIKKCLFVVDRKDLDKQTRDEFNKFQENCVEENTNTEALVRRLISDNYADKIIVTTLQKLGLALDAKNKYRERLQPLRTQSIVFIFDECHRSQFGKNHDAIKEYFPNSQLFGFTGTPIFAENASGEHITGTESEPKTTELLFQYELHRYTITHAIEDGNVLPFHVSYFNNKIPRNQSETKRKTAIVETILENHDRSTAHRQFNALFATASINDAIDYYHIFKSVQSGQQLNTPDFRPLKIACVFSPPATANPDIQQIQEDLIQEKQDYKSDPDPKKAALESIIADYSAQYGGKFDLANFDLYYQDIQTRIKNKQHPKTDYPTPDSRKNWENQQIDITIVVDMLLTGFDAKYLNTLYVDKKLKYHGLIQAFSRTNRVLNGTKPFGNIIVFSDIQAEQERAIELFSGVEAAKAQETWIVEAAQVKIEKLAAAVENVKKLMTDHGLAFSPSEVTNLKGNRAKLEFLEHFKQVQRLERQLEQYVDLNDTEKARIDEILPQEELWGFKAAYKTTAYWLKPTKPVVTPPENSEGSGEKDNPPPEFDSEFVLFSTVVIDYDYIIDLIAKMNGPNIKSRKTKEQILNLIKGDAKFLPEDYPIWEKFIDQLPPDSEVGKVDIHRKFAEFKEEFMWGAFATIAKNHELNYDLLQNWVREMQKSLYFDHARLDEIVAPFGLGWKDRDAKRRAIMRDLIPPLEQLVGDRVINGLAVYKESGTGNL